MNALMVEEVKSLFSQICLLEIPQGTNDVDALREQRGRILREATQFGDPTGAKRLISHVLTN